MLPFSGKLHITISADRQRKKRLYLAEKLHACLYKTYYSWKAIGISLQADFAITTHLLKDLTDLICSSETTADNGQYQYNKNKEQDLRFRQHWLQYLQNQI